MGIRHFQRIRNNIVYYIWSLRCYLYDLNGTKILGMIYKKKKNKGKIYLDEHQDWSNKNIRKFNNRKKKKNTPRDISSTSDTIKNFDGFYVNLSKFSFTGKKCPNIFGNVKSIVLTLTIFPTSSACAPGKNIYPVIPVILWEMRIL